MFIATEFNPTGGVVGGVLIGFASSALLYLTGKVTGISGIAHTIVTARSFHSLTGWRLSYLAGLVGTGAVLQAVWPSAFGAPSQLRPWAAVVAGLLVGFGTRLGSGCTSGHGVCGLPRLSPRSLVAVLSFMATGAAAASLVRSAPVAPYVFQPTPFAMGGAGSSPGTSWWVVVPTLSIIGASLVLFRKPNWFVHGDGHTGEEPVSGLAEHAASIATSSLFAVALAVGGMVNPTVVQGFLDFAGSSGWNPTLAGVMGGAVIVNLATFPAMRTYLTRPLLEPKRTFADIISMGTAKPNTLVNWQLVVGGALFGAGWGLGGFCPGPAIVSLGARSNVAGLVVPSMLVGMAVYEATLGAGLWHARHHHHGHKHGHGHSHGGHAAHDAAHTHGHGHAHAHAHGGQTDAAPATTAAAATAPAPAAPLTPLADSSTPLLLHAPANAPTTPTAVVPAVASSADAADATDLHDGIHKRTAVAAAT